MSTDQTHFPLNTGSSIPAVGLGTWKSGPGEVSRAVAHAIAKGYRHIDGAACYANENEVGEGIRQGIKEAGIKREDLFVTSKLWNTKHHPDDVESACKKTLSDLGLDYLDLYLIHWPTAFKRGDSPFPKNEDGTMQYEVNITPLETWLAMEKLVEKGLVKAIGVANFNSEQIKEICEKGSIKPAVNQVECQPYLNQSKLLAFCKDLGVHLTAYSPLGSPDRPWAQPDDPKLLEDTNLLEIAKRVGKTPAQVLIKWQVQRGLSVIPKSVTPSRIEENFSVFDFTLSSDDMKAIDAFDKGPEGRIIVPLINGKPRDAAHPHYPFNIEF